MLLRMAERSSGLLRPAGRPARQVRAWARAALVIEHDRLAKLKAISGVQEPLVGELAIDERTVSRAEIDNPIRLFLLPELRMAARDLGIMEPDGVGVVPSQGHGSRLKLEPLALVGPLDDEQGGHEVVSPCADGIPPKMQNLMVLS